MVASTLHADGRSPCPGSGANAYELDEFVRMALHGSDDERDEIELTFPVVLTCLWRKLEFDLQRRLLPEVIATVHVDIERGQVKIELTRDAVKMVVAASEKSKAGDS